MKYILKKTNTEFLETKTTMSSMKNILEEISIRLDTAKEKMDTSGELAMGTIKKWNKIFFKKGKFYISNIKHFTYNISFNLKILGRYYYVLNFIHKHTAEKNRHTNSHSNQMPEPVSEHTQQVAEIWASHLAEGRIS